MSADYKAARHSIVATALWEVSVSISFTLHSVLLLDLDISRGSLSRATGPQARNGGSLLNLTGYKRGKAAQV